MIEELIASRHWPYIWPCYVLAVTMFAGLAAQAIVQLRKWEKAAHDAG